MKDELEGRVEKAVKTLLKRKILVGIPGDAKATSPGEGKAPPLCDIGYINEFGDAELNIPPRPFLIPGVESVRDKITSGLRKAAAAAFDGDMARADAYLEGVALVAAYGPKSIIASGTLTPLSPKTIYNRQHRKGPPKTPPPVTRTNPLQDMGDLFRSIGAVVKRG